MNKKEQKIKILTGKYRLSPANRLDEVGAKKLISIDYDCPKCCVLKVKKRANSTDFTLDRQGISRKPSTDKRSVCTVFLRIVIHLSAPANKPLASKCLTMFPITLEQVISLDFQGRSTRQLVSQSRSKYRPPPLV